MKVALRIDRTHNPFDETHWVSRLRENLTSGSDGEGLETGRTLISVPRQSFTRQLFFRDIKTTMGMDILRCRTPAMVNKEILMYLIAYNAIRLLIFNAAKNAMQSPRQISFKASMQALRQWEPLFNRMDMNDRERRRLTASLTQTIAANVITPRPGRREPRCLKRRPKPYALLTAPRHEMIEIPHRNRYRAKQA